jgi:hypothetical protein
MPAELFPESRNECRLVSHEDWDTSIIVFNKLLSNHNLTHKSLHALEDFMIYISVFNLP